MSDDTLVTEFDGDVTLILPDTPEEGSFLVSDGNSISWEPTTTTFGELAFAVGDKSILLDFDGCTDGQIVAYRDSKVQCETPTYKEANMNYWTVSGILTIVIVSVITTKFIVPKINWRTLVRGFFNIFYKPAKKEADAISKEWNDIKSN